MKQKHGSWHQKPAGGFMAVNSLELLHVGPIYTLSCRIKLVCGLCSHSDLVSPWRCTTSKMVKLNDSFLKTLNIKCSQSQAGSPLSLLV